MHILEENLKKAEKRYASSPTSRNALALFACEILISRTIDPDSAHLSKAFHIAYTAHQEDKLDLSLFNSQLYANVLLENYENAYEQIRAIEASGSFLSKNMPEVYGQVLHFYSIVQAMTERVRSAKKVYRNLELVLEKTNIPELLFYLGSLQRRVFEDADVCAKMYLDVIKSNRAVFFMLESYDLLKHEEQFTPEMNEIAKIVIPWAINKDLDIGEMLERLEKRTLIEILFSLNSQYLSKIFEKYEHVGAFQCLCQKLIFENAISDKALYYYAIALKNNLALRGLEEMSVKAAYKNKFYDMPLQAVEKSLRTPTNFDSKQLAFMFSIIINQEDHEAINEQRENIIKFGIWANQKGYRGKDFDTIYKYLYEISGRDKRFVDIMLEEVFKSEIRFNGQVPDYVCVYEYAKAGITTWKTTGSKCRVSSCGDFDCYFLGDDQNEYLLIDNYTVTRLVDDKDVELLESLYQRRANNNDVVLALALHYVNETDYDKGKLDVLQRAAALDEISESFKNDICSALAEHYARCEQYSLAIHYYSYIGEDKIKPKNLETALKTYIATGKHDMALSLITKKHMFLSDSLVFSAVDSLNEKAQTLEIASICYGLILNGLCSTEVLNIVLKKFKGTSDEWLVVALKIDSLGFDASQLFEKIIVDGIFTGSINRNSNEAFERLYEKYSDHPVIIKYVYFCCYEIIRNGKTVPEDVCAILEQLFYENDDEKILVYAIALNYLKTGRMDKMPIISEAAMYMQEDDIIFEGFKTHQDKSFISSYIEKNTPFTHYRTPHKNICICYKTTDKTSFTKLPMKYFRFGMYLINLKLFYGEKMTYYFEDDKGVKTDVKVFTNQHMKVVEQYDDMYYSINNAIIYEHMMNFDVVEELVEDVFKNKEQFTVLTM